jgi:DNA invertase Pin-like site-specific DNA recombinase
MNYSYSRVSTEKQDIRRQQQAFEGLQIDKAYSDKLSGKNLERPELNKLRLQATEGDNIYIESISRLGRNVDDLRQLVNEFQEKGVIVHFIKEGLNTGNGNNMFKFMLTILAAVAEMEREVANVRIKEGLAKAKIHGTKTGNRLGRPEVILPSNFKRYYKQWKEESLTATDFAKIFNVSRPTIYRYIKIHEGKQA